MISIGSITPEVLRAALRDSASKRLLRERIETKIEEYREARDDSPSAETDGIIEGLRIALDIIEEP